MSTATTPAVGSDLPPSVKMITLTIDGLSVQVPEKTSVLDAARKAGIIIPALCHKEDLNPVGVCRVCTVSVKGDRVYPAACMRECRDGMVVESGCERTAGLRAPEQELGAGDLLNPEREKV